jgi:hypothetical protein
MDPKMRLLRIFWALSGKTEEEFAQDIGIDPAALELGGPLPNPVQLERAAAEAGITVSNGEELLSYADTLRRPRLRVGRGAEDIFDEIAETARAHARATYQRLLRLPLPEREPKPEDRLEASKQLKDLKGLPAPVRSSVVKVGRELQSWALCVAAAEESANLSAGDLEQATAWARLAQEIAELVRGPEVWRNRLRGLAAAHMARILKISGQRKESEAAFKQAKKLWRTGADPYNLLDPSLETSLFGSE